MKRFIAVLSAVLLSGGTSLARTPSRTLTPRIAPPATKSQNTVTLSDASGRGETNYPLQFGRPFLRGAVPAGKCPVVSANGFALRTQADVKNRYPDGSAEFAVVAVVVPHIPANGSVRLGFAPGVCNNTPLTQAQMLDARYNFDAQEQLVTPGAIFSGVWRSGNNAQPALTAVTNGGMQITLNGKNCDIEGLNFSGATTWPQLEAIITAPLSACAGTTVSEVANPKKPGVSATEFQAKGITFGYASAPTSGTDISALMALTQAAGATLGAPATDVASARTMLRNGDYKRWTSGPVAQTVILADDSPTRKYDLSPNGDSHHPFRPRFVATFWPATHQVFVRAIGENGLSTELEDIGPYNLTITGGQNSPATEESFVKLTQLAMQTWTKTFWLGGTPAQQVNIDNNLAYLESTRFVPNYDPTITLSPTTIANRYAFWWTNTSHDIGGSGAWTPGMGTTGGRDDIGPEPGWDVAWLYSGDWRMRQAALGNTDLAGWWPVNVRETDPNAVLNRGDAAGTGYSKPISITYRKWVGPSLGGEGMFLYYNSCSYCTTQPNSLKVVGTLNIPTSWTFDSAHEPGPFFVPYILTGDPWYLNELKMWAAYDATSNPGGNQGNTAGAVNARGPTGEEGGFFGQLRGDGWMIRSRAEAAFAIPDGDPFKKYLTILMQEGLARWDGVFGVADPALSSYPEYAWGQTTGNPHTSTSFGNPPPSPALHNWEAEPVPDGQYNQQIWVSGTGLTEPWMQNFVQYELGRATELGFAAKPLALYSGQYLIGMINDSGYPQLVCAYFLPSWTASGQITSWPHFVANLQTPWLTGNGYTGGAAEGDLPHCFTNLGAGWGPQEYDMMAFVASSSLVDLNAPGASQAAAWLNTNVYQPQKLAIAADPLWAIVPRADHNALPAQPTAPQ